MEQTEMTSHRVAPLPWSRHRSNYRISKRRFARQRGNILRLSHKTTCKWPAVSTRPALGGRWLPWSPA